MQQRRKHVHLETGLHVHNPLTRWGRGCRALRAGKKNWVQRMSPVPNSMWKRVAVHHDAQFGADVLHVT